MALNLRDKFFFRHFCDFQAATVRSAVFLRCLREMFLQINEFSLLVGRGPEIAELLKFFRNDNGEEEVMRVDFSDENSFEIVEAVGDELNEFILHKVSYEGFDGIILHEVQL